MKYVIYMNLKRLFYFHVQIIAGCVWGEKMYFETNNDKNYFKGQK